MPAPDQRISEYVLESKLGAGAFGEVWKAHHHVWTDQLVAIKIPTDPQYLRNLQREGAAIHGLVHPNIVRAMGFDPYASPAYLVMEYVPGTSLRPLIVSRKIGIPDSVAIMRQILAGLSYAHAQGMIHRDIKPENILVHQRAFLDGFNTQGVVKITDFGLGKAKAAMGTGSIAFSQSMSSPGGREIAGTLDYMAPEQRGGGAEPDTRCDLYACGVVLYELLTGERPAGTDVPSDLNPAVPKYLDEVFRRSYARLERRYQSADEFSEALVMPLPPPLPGTAGPAQQARTQASPQSAPQPASQTVTDVCPQCRNAIDPGDQFCMHCGVQLVPVVRRCSQCGAYPDRADAYCIFCGAGLTAAVATV
jgi:serine/threonine protein kinase